MSNPGSITTASLRPWRQMMYEIWANGLRFDRLQSYIPPQASRSLLMLLAVGSRRRSNRLAGRLLCIPLEKLTGIDPLAS